VNLVDPETKWGTWIYWAYNDSGKRVWISKRSGSIIPRPSNSHLTYAAWAAKKELNKVYDTIPDDVLQVTYKGENF